MIELRGIRKRYGPVTALAGVDLELRPGEVVGLVGPNGAGKTTLLKVLLGLVQPDAGELRVDGVVTRPGPAFRADLGYMPQVASFPGNLTGTEVLALLAALRGRAVPGDGLVERLHLAAELGRPIARLSEGTRQKLSAALAFAFAPALLVLDEPSAGLDPLATTVLKDAILAERARGRMLLISSHVMAEIEELCDRIVFLTDGRVRFSGHPGALSASTGQLTLERAIAALMSGTPA